MWLYYHSDIIILPVNFKTFVIYIMERHILLESPEL